MRAHRVHLPSGLEVRARVPSGALRDDDVVAGERLRFGRALTVLLTPGALERRDGSAWITMREDEVLALAMRDFHVLRDLLLRTGTLAPEPDDDATCRNCDAPLAFDPRSLDPADLERAHQSASQPARGHTPLPSPVRLARGEIAREVTMEPVTIGRARPLLAALARDEPFRVTPTLLIAMGVRTLGTNDRPVLVARALGRASDEVWAAVERRYLELNRAPTIVAPLPCPSCGAMHEVEVPTPDELDAREPRPRPDGAPSFPDAEAFEALVERLAPEVYEARRIVWGTVALRVEPGVPATDIAGEPLLGSYEPRMEVDAAGYSQLEFLVTLYHRSFERMWLDDGPYDLEHEIRDTLDHELEHHLHHLAGHDPMDAQERADARRELRSLYGDRRLVLMVVRDVALDVLGFLRATWPFFAVIGVGVAIAVHLGWLMW